MLPFDISQYFHLNLKVLLLPLNIIEFGEYENIGFVKTLKVS